MPPLCEAERGTGVSSLDQEGVGGEFIQIKGQIGKGVTNKKNLL